MNLISRYTKQDGEIVNFILGENMELKPDFIEKVINCSWFENCGDQNFDTFEVIFLKDKMEIPKSIQSYKWENICLDKRGDFSSAILLNYEEQYSLIGEEYEKVQKEVLAFSKRFTVGLKRKGIRFGGIVLSDVKFNVQTLFLINHYSEYYTTDIFFEQMLEIYLLGHLPCGWSGGQKNGIFKVY